MSTGRRVGFITKLLLSSSASTLSGLYRAILVRLNSLRRMVKSYYARRTGRRMRTPRAGSPNRQLFFVDDVPGEDYEDLV
ncbi:hypothetical protein TeGR_g6103 [Tetraparma gracilis]|uniref:Uncharacterized protein n=1 Tax=Tetraparma gracilis TaxID=2962635 RepID=A0ABQ6MIQ6_9STRA|nr:hypothetical protein TeGR_g6103 [Tetraparma gracilis]